MRRRAARYRVCVQVSYELGGERHQACAENLSRHGLFVREGGGLTAGTELELAIHLPGDDGDHHCRARVAHRLGDGAAGGLGRRGGAGLEILAADDGFEAALAGYLARLAGRSDAEVWVAGEPATTLLSAAGFAVAPAPEPGQVRARLEAGERPIALVCGRDRREAYRGAGAPVVVVLEGADDVDAALAALDARL